MTDKPYTPTDEEMRDEFIDLQGTFANGSWNEGSLKRWNRWLAERDARIRAEEREHVNQQIQNRLYDFEPEEKEDGYLISPATITIKAHDLNDIIAGGDSDVRFSFTDLELENHVSEVAATAEQRGAVRALRKAQQINESERLYG